MNLVNPTFALKDKNIFKLRSIDYDNMMNKIAEIVKPVEEIGFTISELDIKESKASNGELQKTLKKKI